MMSRISEDNVVFTFRERPSTANPQPIPTDELGDKNRFKKHFQQKLQQKKVRAEVGINQGKVFEEDIPGTPAPPTLETRGLLNDAASSPFLAPPSPAVPRPLSPAPLSSTGLSRQVSLDDPEQAVKEALPATVTRDQLARLAGTRDLETAEELIFQLDLSETPVLEAVGHHCSKLQCLVLDESKNFGSFRDLSPDLRHLQKLSLAKSGIEELDGIGILESLRELQLAHNNVQDLTPLFMHETLQVLGLLGNKVADLRAIQVLATCPLLYSLDLRRNPVQKTLPCFREVVAHHISQLKVLDCQGIAPEEGLGLDEDIMTEIHKAAELRQSMTKDLSPERPSGALGHAREQTGPAAEEEEEEKLGFDGSSHLTLGHTVFAGNFSKSLRDRRLKGPSAGDRTLDLLATLDLGLELGAPARKELLDQWRNELQKQGSVAYEGALALKGKHRLDPLAQEEQRRRRYKGSSHSPKRKGQKHRLQKKVGVRPSTAPESPPSTRSPLVGGAAVESSRTNLADYGFSTSGLASRTWSPQKLQAARSNSSDVSAQLKNRRPHTAQGTKTLESHSPSIAWGFTPRAGESAPAGNIMQPQPKLLFALDWSNASSRQRRDSDIIDSERESLGVVRPSTAGSSFWGDSSEQNSREDLLTREGFGVESTRQSTQRPGSARPISRGAYGIAAQQRSYRARASGIPVVGDATDSDESSDDSESAMDDSKRRPRGGRDEHSDSSDDSDIEITRRNMKKHSLSIASKKGSGASGPLSTQLRKSSFNGLPPRPEKATELGAFQRRASRANEVGKQMGFDLLSSLKAIDDWIDHTVSSASEEDSDLVPAHRDRIIAQAPSSGDLSSPPKHEAQKTGTEGHELALSPSENNYFDEEADAARSPKALVKTYSGFSPKPFEQSAYPTDLAELDFPEAALDGGVGLDSFMPGSELNNLQSPFPASSASGAVEQLGGATGCQQPRTPQGNTGKNRNLQSAQLGRVQTPAENSDAMVTEPKQKEKSQNEKTPKLAISFPDSDLIDMLKKPPKTIPEMRTKDRFRSFFTGFPASRLQSLLMSAFDDLDADQQQKKVSKRIKMVEDVLV